MYGSRWGLVALLLAVSVLCSSPASASSGDRNPVFRDCVARCTAIECHTSITKLSTVLRLFAWTCPENCAYRCSHAFTDNIPPGGTYQQFYGKWVFYRLGGIQEPASVLFSLLNLVVHVRGLKLVRRKVRHGNPLRPWIILLPWIQINTWIWSTVFHTRDTPVTEKLDYFSAVLTIGISLFYTIIRLFHLYTPQRRILCSFATGTFLLILLSHYAYLLSFPTGRFPYGYNVMFSLVLGMTHNLLWIAYSFSFRLSSSLRRFLPLPEPYPLRSRTALSKQTQWPLYLVLATTASMSLELFDFAPYWRAVDAHSLWHAATVPIAVGWYHFTVWDVAEVERERLVGKERES